MTHGLIAVIVLFPSLAQLGNADDSQNARETIQGEWRVTSLHVRGQHIGIDNLADGSYIFTGHRFKVTGAQECGGEVKLNPMVTPKRIDLKAMEGVGEGKTVFGIYKFEGAKLVLCLGETRPKGFTGDGDAGLLVLERQKEEK